MSTKFKAFSIVVACIFITAVTSSFSLEEDWIPLLDKNLSRWGMYLSFRHLGSYKGEAPVNEKDEIIQPIGYDKNTNNVFTVMEESGEPVLKISGEIYGCVFTREEFENYHLKLKVKWGSKKWIPRVDKFKDSGVLYHSIGECGVDYWRSWMLGQEFQIMEGHVGDFWSIGNSVIDIRALPSQEGMNAVANSKKRFITIGLKDGTDRGFCLRSEDYESAAGEWTEIELICFGDKSLHIVNGHVVMILQNSRYIQGDKFVPLTKGKIQLQSEAAEVYYKDIMIRNINAMPKEYASYFQ